MKAILVIRFSSLGDVALVVPVFKTLEEYLPDQKFIFASSPAFRDLIASCRNVTFHGADLPGKHKGLSGLNRLFGELDRLDTDMIIDIHNVLRTKLIKALFKLNGKRVYTYNKMRSAKNARLAGSGVPGRIPHTAEQYLKAFSSLQPGMKLIPGPWIHINPAASQLSGRNVCLAPFSSHDAKEWPHGSMLKLIGLLEAEGNIHIHCMAFGSREEGIFREWKKSFPGLNLIGVGVPLGKQLELLAGMDVLVSMDSANMHLAAIIGTPVISLWGPTHPDLGFAPLGNRGCVLQPGEEYSGPRPLSRYGRLLKAHERKAAQEALASISPGRVIESIRPFLKG